MYRVFLDNIREHFSHSSHSMHKARNEIRVIEYEDKQLVVKSFKIPHFLNRIVYTFFRESKAKKSYDNSIKIGDFAPNPIGYRIFKKFGLISHSYFVSENFEYDFTIREPLLDNLFDDRENIFKAFAKFTYDLHQNAILHLDYSPGNILIKKENEGYIFKVVDVNRMKFKRLTLDERLENFKMLWAKDEIMSIIIKEYAILAGEDEAYCIEKAIYYSQKQKDFKNMKKRLKGIEVVD